MTKEKKQKDKKVDLFVIIMTIAMVVLLVVWVIKDHKPKKVEEPTPVTEQPGLESFNKINLEEALKLIKDDELTLIYIGYKGCRPCDSFVPVLAEISQSYHDLKVNYIDIKEIDKESNEWESFTKKMNKKQKITIKKDDKEEEYNKTIGKYLIENGYTPTFVVFKSNKLVDGHVGGLSKKNLGKFLSTVGFKKKLVDF